MRHLSSIVVGAAIALMALSSAEAAEVEVKMLNHGQKGFMVFEPDLVLIQPGDSVQFVAVDKGHDVVSIDGMLPAGAKPFEGKMNQDLTVKFDVPGVYGVKCKPHYGMGMVGLVAVGSPQNLDQAEAVKHPGKAKKVFSAIFEKYAKVQNAQK